MKYPRFSKMWLAGEEVNPEAGYFGDYQYCDWCGGQLDPAGYTNGFRFVNWDEVYVRVPHIVNLGDDPKITLKRYTCVFHQDTCVSPPQQVSAEVLYHRVD